MHLRESRVSSPLLCIQAARRSRCPSTRQSDRQARILPASGTGQGQAYHTPYLYRCKCLARQFPERLGVARFNRSESSRLSRALLIHLAKPSFSLCTSWGRIQTGGTKEREDGKSERPVHGPKHSPAKPPIKRSACSWAFAGAHPTSQPFVIDRSATHSHSANVSTHPGPKPATSPPPPKSQPLCSRRGATQGDLVLYWTNWTRGSPLGWGLETSATPAQERGDVQGGWVALVARSLGKGRAGNGRVIFSSLQSGPPLRLWIDQPDF